MNGYAGAGSFLPGKRWLSIEFLYVRWERGSRAIPCEKKNNIDSVKSRILTRNFPFLENSI